MIAPAVRRWQPQVVPLLRSLWPEGPYTLPWALAQIQVESGGDPEAQSDHGAQGLLQLMPATAQELGVDDVFDPFQSLYGGFRYLRQQYDRFPEIPTLDDRLRWSLAAYNGGRGYCNRALALARLEEPDLWWTWREGRRWLMHRLCLVRGLTPDHLQIWGYVRKIEALVP